MCYVYGTHITTHNNNRLHEYALCGSQSTSENLDVVLNLSYVTDMMMRVESCLFNAVTLETHLH